MKECDEELLTAFADGAATSDEAARVSRHLESCADCARELRWLKAGKAALAALPRPALPPELRAVLMNEAKKRQRTRLKEFLSWLTEASLPRGLGLAFAAATVFLLAGRSEEVPLEDLLAAHEEYAATLPAAPRESSFWEVSDER